MRKTRAENRFMITLPALTEFEYTAPALVTKVCINIHEYICVILPIYIRIVYTIFALLYCFYVYVYVYSIRYICSTRIPTTCIPYYVYVCIVCTIYLRRVGLEPQCSGRNARCRPCCIKGDYRFIPL